MFRSFPVLAFVIITTWGCTRHEVEVKPVEIKPIHITVDVNVRIEKAVEDFYGDIYGDQPDNKAKQQ
jgi:hypothetical protein